MDFTPLKKRISSFSPPITPKKFKDETTNNQNQKPNNATPHPQRTPKKNFFELLKEHQFEDLSEKKPELIDICEDNSQSLINLEDVSLDLLDSKNFFDMVKQNEEKTLTEKKNRPVACLPTDFSLRSTVEILSSQDFDWFQEDDSELFFCESESKPRKELEQKLTVWCFPMYASELTSSQPSSLSNSLTSSSTFPSSDLLDKMLHQFKIAFKDLFGRFLFQKISSFYFCHTTFTILFTGSQAIIANCTKGLAKHLEEKGLTDLTLHKDSSTASLSGHSQLKQLYLYLSDFAYKEVPELICGESFSFGTLVIPTLESKGKTLRLSRRRTKQNHPYNLKIEGFILPEAFQFICSFLNVHQKSHLLIQSTPKSYTDAFNTLLGGTFWKQFECKEGQFFI